MNNLLVLPLLIPLSTAVALIFFKNRIMLQRTLSVFSLLAASLCAALLVLQVKAEGIQTLHMGGWLPPYGIVFVGDMLASLLVLASSAVALFCLIYSFDTVGREREKQYYYPLLQFLLVGVNGSFLTGDLFNLFVCFEVMLISSYALLVLGGTKRQLREALKYMMVNILSSSLFVAGVAYLYGVTGTLNMAHLSIRVAEAGQGGILNAVAVLFLIVFSLKAGLFLFFWLPGSYSAPPAAVTALFGALLTKVGLYALLRVFTLIFYHRPELTHVWMAWMAGATMALGACGAVAYKDLWLIMNYNIVISAGLIAFGLAVASSASLEGAVFYLLHDIVAKGLLLILGGMAIQISGTSKLNEMGGRVGRYPLVGALFFIAALAIAGIPPLSGFAGKLLLVQGGLQEQSYVLSGLALGSSLIVLYSLVRVFMSACWGETKQQSSGGAAPSKAAYISAVCLFLLVAAMGLGSEWVYRLAAAAGETLLFPAVYVNAVLAP